VQYGGATLAVWVALSLWALTPTPHRHLFSLLLAAVLFTARFLGFGPALFCSLVSTACLDFFVVPPYFSFGIHSGADVERLAAFLAISVFAGSMARQFTAAIRTGPSPVGIAPPNISMATLPRRQSGRM
jgi:two-component system sensor histidine kinase KdpD